MILVRALILSTRKHFYTVVSTAIVDLIIRDKINLKSGYLSAEFALWLILPDASRFYKPIEP